MNTLHIIMMLISINFKFARLEDVIDLLPQDECGLDIQNKVVGGSEMQLEEHPWMALIIYTSKNKEVQTGCGGSLINPRYVLTASHCVHEEKINHRIITWKASHVRLGEWNTTSDIDCKKFRTEEICNDPSIDVPIEQEIIHENYKPKSSNQHNDIALLRLSRNVEYTNYIRPICLPVSEELRLKKLVNDTMTVAGWGGTENGTKSQVKLKVNVNGVTNDECQEVLIREGRDIIESQLCAGGIEGIDSCRGDSGGSLMRLNEKGVPPFWYAAGIVSYGKDCGKADWPSVYTRVAHYVDWIRSNVKA